MVERVEADVTSQLLGMLAHDLRNPLSALHSNIGFLQTMLTDVDEDSHDALLDALVSCDGLLFIIDNIELLAVALEAPRDFARAPIAVRTLIEETVNRHRALASSHGVELLVVPGSDFQRIMVLGNHDMLSRALGNLVRNSIQHSGTGPVRLEFQQAPGSCTISVADFGSPISEEFRSLAFTAAGQVLAKSATGGRYGRGLGLFAARIAAEAAGAELALRSGPGTVGNRFELLVPTA